MTLFEGRINSADVLKGHAFSRAAYIRIINAGFSP
jgi:hypothetical protein